MTLHPAAGSLPSTARIFDRQEVLKHTMDMIRTIVNVEAGSLLLLEGEELAFKVAFNVDPAIDTTILNSFRVRLGQGITGYQKSAEDYGR